jgi:hypothetical protein
MRLSFDRIGALLVNSIIHQHSNLRWKKESLPYCSFSLA